MSYTTDNLAASIKDALSHFLSGRKVIEITEHNNTKTIKVVTK